MVAHLLLSEKQKPRCADANVMLCEQLEFWGGIKALPWVIKPVYGLLSDAVPLLGYHRRSYLILFSLMGDSSPA